MLLFISKNIKDAQQIIKDLIKEIKCLTSNWGGSESIKRVP
jgi:hypothetical protein